MTIEFRCTECNNLLRAAEDKAGVTTARPSCGMPVTVPFEDVAPPSSRADHSGSRPCPMCGEPIASTAVRCSYCGERVGGGRPAVSSPSASNSLAIVSLVLGIVSIPMNCCCEFVSVPLGLASIVTGVIAWGRCNRGVAQGKELAIVGSVLGSVSLLLVLVRIAFFGFFAILGR